MVALKFTNPEVDKKYTSDKDSNPTVHLPGGRDAKGWKGKLADIPMKQADRWAARPTQNLLKLKDAAPAAEEKASKKAKENLN